MLTLFTVPKPFSGNTHICTIQHNAIQSWLRLSPACEIILMGKDREIKKTAEHYKIRHIPTIHYNEYGTPLVDSIFKEAQKATRYPLLCYINTDIILLSNFLQAINETHSALPQSLIIGRRWDIDINIPMTFDTYWQENLQHQAKCKGKLHAHTGMDYFVFPKGLWKNIPPFALGRYIWDSWLVYHIHSRNIPIIDITKMTMAIHQNHDYAHIHGHQKNKKILDKGPEAEQNYKLAGGITHAYTILDAHYKLTKKGLKQNITPYKLYRKLSTSAEKNFLSLIIFKTIRKVREKIIN